MKEIKLFKCQITELEKTIHYELDMHSRKETIVKWMNQKSIVQENILDSVSFADKFYRINQNTNVLKEKYIENSRIDGTTIQMEIIYQDNTQKQIVCKNKFPEEINQIIEMIKL